MQTTGILIINKIKDRSLRLAFFAAEECGRTPVTAKWLYEHPDTQAYIFNSELEIMGIDPWTKIEGVDSMTKEPKIILNYGVASEKVVAPYYIVFI